MHGTEIVSISMPKLMLIFLLIIGATIFSSNYCFILRKGKGTVVIWIWFNANKHAIDADTNVPQDAMKLPCVQRTFGIGAMEKTFCSLKRW